MEYDSNWLATTLPNEREVLQYKDEQSFLGFAGRSALSDSITDFDTASGKKELYTIFYDYWNNPDNNDGNFKIYNGSNGFNKLTDSIYYATYDYGVSSTNIKGKYIVLVSPTKNVTLSFVTNADNGVAKNDARAVELLKNIEIYQQPLAEEENNQTNTSNNNIIYDDFMANSLAAMSDWNRYSDVRNGNLGDIKTLDGGWRTLSDLETYWQFKGDQFWWYKSINNLNDNYWYGTTQIFTGKTGFSVAGIDESKLAQVISNSSLNITEDDVYTIVFSPTKIISGGIDKSSTNIPTGGTWTHIWILIDHGVEGIEAQVLNMETYEVEYYVKISD